jgi:hypothetical protein
MGITTRTTEILLVVVSSFFQFQFLFLFFLILLVPAKREGNGSRVYEAAAGGKTDVSAFHLFHVRIVKPSP